MRLYHWLYILSDLNLDLWAFVSPHTSKDILELHNQFIMAFSFSSTSLVDTLADESSENLFCLILVTL